MPELAQHLRETWEERVTRRTNEEQDEHETPDYAELVQQIASHFLDTLWEAKSSVLLYAQRDALKTWFPGFDPSLPEMMEDRNRPWDWDHLLPQSYFSGRWGIPQSVKDWGNSIGNLRAWPLEANRSMPCPASNWMATQAPKRSATKSARVGENGKRRLWMIPTGNGTGKVPFPTIQPKTTYQIVPTPPPTNIGLAQ